MKSDDQLRGKTTPESNSGSFAPQEVSDKDYPKEVERAEEIAVLTGMKPADKIASVHIERGKDNILPELNNEDLKKLGVLKNKPVLIKANITERNAFYHSDICPIDDDKIIAEALYNSDNIFHGKNEKPYFNFIKSLRLSPNGKEREDCGIVLLDVSESKDYFEVVHWHWIGINKLYKLKKRNEKSIYGGTANSSSNLIGSRSRLSAVRRYFILLVYPTAHQKSTP